MDNTCKELSCDSASALVIMTQNAHPVVGVDRLCVYRKDRMGNKTH